MKRRLTVCLIVACLLSTGITLSGVRGQQPAQSNSIQVAGLLDRVTIRRDERGIAYMDAKNDEDLYFAQGYVTASDRLWQMDLFRRTERGELAEILTAGPNNIALEQDKQHRTLGFAQVAEAEVTQASPKRGRCWKLTRAALMLTLPRSMLRACHLNFKYFNTSQSHGPRRILC